MKPIYWGLGGPWLIVVLRRFADLELMMGIANMAALEGLRHGPIELNDGRRCQIKGW